MTAKEKEYAYPKARVDEPGSTVIAIGFPENAPLARETATSGYTLSRDTEAENCLKFSAAMMDYRSQPPDGEPTADKPICINAEGEPASEARIYATSGVLRCGAYHGL